MRWTDQGLDLSGTSPEEVRVVMEAVEVDGSGIGPVWYVSWRRIGRRFGSGSIGVQGAVVLQLLIPAIQVRVRHLKRCRWRWKRFGVDGSGVGPVWYVT